MATATEHKNVVLTAQVRKERGSRKSQALRASGLLPAIIYGHKQESLSVTLPAVETEALIHSGKHIIDVNLDGKTEKVLIQDVQYDYLQSEIEHVDLLRVDPNQKVKVKVPLDFRGIPKGAREGGILETQIAELEVEVLVTAIPDIIRVNVEHLELHAILHVKDIPVPEGTRVINSPEQIVAQVRTVKEEVAPVEAQAVAAEPEVIGKKPTEEGAAAAEGDAKASPAAKK